MKLLTLLFVLCLSASGAPAYVQANYGEAFPSTSVTVNFNSATAAGNFLAVGVRPSDGSLSMTVTAGGKTFTKVATAPIITEYSYTLYVLSNAPSLTAVTASNGNSSDQQRMWIAEFSGVGTNGTVIEHSNTNNGSGTVLNAGNVTSATDGVLLLMAGSTDSDEFHTDPTPSAGWTMINLQTCCDDDKTAIMYRVAGAAGSYGGTMTDDQPPDWAAIIGAFAAAGGGGGGGPVTYPRALGRVDLTGKATLQ